MDDEFEFIMSFIIISFLSFFNKEVNVPQILVIHQCKYTCMHDIRKIIDL